MSVQVHIWASSQHGSPVPKAGISRDGNESGQALTGPAWSRTYLPKQETQEMQVQSLEEGMTAHSGILAGRMPRAADYSPWGHTESDTTERLRTASSGHTESDTMERLRTASSGHTESDTTERLRTASSGHTVRHDGASENGVFRPHSQARRSV